MTERSRTEHNTTAHSTTAHSTTQGGATRDGRLPVILISFNRGSMMRKVVDGFRKQSVEVEVFVHDNGSDDPATRVVLAQLEAEGVTVFHRPKINSPEELNLVDESVQRIFADRPPSPYAVSDCDVSIAESSPTTLQTYLDVLEAMPEIECAGPMLRIDDVPRSYPLYNAMINRHIGRFWGHEPEWAAVAGHRVAFQRAPIDTTLAVYRAGEPFRRLRQGVRLYPPYAARHLDWYPEEHDEAYRTSADGSTISNWSNPARERASGKVPIKFTEYRTVVEDANGNLVAVTRSITPDAEQQTPGALQTLAEGIHRALAPAWSHAVDRAWVWRDRAAVLDVGFATDRLGFDIVAESDQEWMIHAVARNASARRRLQAAGLRAGSDGRYGVGLVRAVGSPTADTVSIAGALDVVLSTLDR
jgi:hypothetical protein